jgi:hypothetical protein
MKIIKVVTVLLTLVALFTPILACKDGTDGVPQEPGGSESINTATISLEQVKDQRLSEGTVVIGNEAEAVSTVKIIMQSLNGIMGSMGTDPSLQPRKNLPRSIQGAFLGSMPEGFSIDGLDAFMMAGGIGSVTAKAEVDEEAITTADYTRGSMGMTLDSTLLVNHTLPLAQYAIDINGDSVVDFTPPQVFMDGIVMMTGSITSINLPPSNLDAEFSMGTKMTLGRSFEIGAPVVIESVHSGVDVAFSLTGTDLSMLIDVTNQEFSGTISASLAYTARMVVVVSSGDAEIKGGKLLLTTYGMVDFGPLEVNAELFGAIMGETISDYLMENFVPEQFMGSDVSLKVYDDTNDLVYTGVLRLEDLVNLEE